MIILSVEKVYNVWLPIIIDGLRTHTFCVQATGNSALGDCVIMAFLVVAGLSCLPVEEACGKIPMITHPKKLVPKPPFLQQL
jgi:hypothetical protein